MDTPIFLICLTTLPFSLFPFFHRPPLSPFSSTLKLTHCSYNSLYYCHVYASLAFLQIMIVTRFKVFYFFKLAKNEKPGAPMPGSNAIMQIQIKCKYQE